jgi:hypothetical protein|tara:strand:- start:180 stop:632 length:453 start_codon:yes stop_codon:yes gene_type:complete
MTQPIKIGSTVEVEWDSSRWRVSQGGEVVGHYVSVTLDETAQQIYFTKTGKRAPYFRKGCRKKVRTVFSGRFIGGTQNDALDTVPPDGKEWATYLLHASKGPVPNDPKKSGWPGTPHVILSIVIRQPLILVAVNASRSKRVHGLSLGGAK